MAEKGAQIYSLERCILFRLYQPFDRNMTRAPMYKRMYLLTDAQKADIIFIAKKKIPKKREKKNKAFVARTEWHCNCDCEIFYFKLEHKYDKYKF